MDQKKKKIDRAVATLLTEGSGFSTKCAEEEDGVQSNFVQYVRNGNTFSPAGHVVLVPKLQEFAYELQRTMGGVNFVKTKARTDELLAFPSSPMQQVFEEIEKFWGLKDNFTKLGFLHNRGILVYGPPGTGKSCLMQQVAESMVKQGDVIFFAKSLGPVEAGLSAFRQIEPDRKTVVVLEDLDEYLAYSERDLLQLLDGDNSVDNVCFLGSTNYIQKFPARLLRPGRFDKRVFVGPPPLEGRLVYLRHKLSEVEDEETIQRIAEQTKGLSFGHLRELVIGAYAFREPIAEVMQRLRSVNVQDLPERKLTECAQAPASVLKALKGSKPKKKKKKKATESYAEIEAAVDRFLGRES